MQKLSAKTIADQKTRLLKQQKELEEELAAFAERDDKPEGDWDARYPKFDSNQNVNLEEEADEVEEYIIRLPIEQSLEQRLEDTRIALEKIKKGTYGTCENCGKQIPLKRLKVYPEARLCLDCKK